MVLIKARERTPLELVFPERVGKPDVFGVAVTRQFAMAVMWITLMLLLR